jgi:hypothetical protein
MTNTNYFSGIVKVLEDPKEYYTNKQTPFTQFRVEVSQKRKSSIASLLVWGNLGRDIKKFYKVNDYILIEGYSSIRPKSTQSGPSNNMKQVFITVIRVYPILLSADRTNAKI